MINYYKLFSIIVFLFFLTLNYYISTRISVGYFYSFTIISDFYLKLLKVFIIIKFYINESSF